MATFPRSMFNSETNYVKANYLCGNNPEINISSAGVTSEIKTTTQATSIVTSMKFNDKASNFSKFVFINNAGNYYLHYSCFNELEELDCQKLAFNSGAAYSRWIDGTSNESTESNIRVINNFTLTNVSTQNYYPFWGLSHLEVVTNTYIYNAWFEIGSHNTSTSTIKMLTFKPGCLFLGVQLFRYDLTRDAMISLFNALQQLNTGDSKTCKVGSDNLAKLTDEDKKIATDKGWTLA